ncbi:hypothetical protein GF325_01315 [Candidatus Bathyarchaeota archaeon]|nr:hypothetical protein [Candidatus Bathyarchaeota archaeon]
MKMVPDMTTVDSSKKQTYQQDSPRSNDPVVSSATYSSFQVGQFIAGALFILASIMQVPFTTKGLLFFLFALSPFIWTGVLPLLTGIILVLRSLVMVQRISISISGESIAIYAKRIWRRCVSIPVNEVNYFHAGRRESKILRWGVILVLVELALEVHLENGIDLLGNAIIAPYLLFSFVILMVAIAALAFMPQQVLRIGTHHARYLIPLPFKWHKFQKEQPVARVLHAIGIGTCRDVDGEAEPQQKLWMRIARAIQGKRLDILLAIILMGTGIAITSRRAFFMGEFTAASCIVLAIKQVHRIIHPRYSISHERNPEHLPPEINKKVVITKGSHVTLGTRRYITVKGLKTWNTHSCTPRTLSVIESNLDSQETKLKPAIVLIHLVEIALLGFIIFQCMYHGMRFAWQSYTRFNSSRFIVSLMVTLVAFFKLSNPTQVLILKFSRETIMVPSKTTRNPREAIRAYVDGFRAWIHGRDPRS